MRPDLNGLIHNIIETIGSLIPFIIIIGTFAGKISKAKKQSEKEKEISRELAMEKYAEMEKKKKKKSDIKKSFLQELNRAFSEEENRKTVRETLYSKEESAGERENLQKDGMNESLKDEDYRFSKNTDDMIREIQREREELRERETVSEKHYEDNRDFEVDIDSEIDAYDLANAFILKEILDKPVSLRD